MTLPIDETDGMPDWINKLAKVAFHLGCGLLAAFIFLSIGVVEHALPKPLHEIMIQVVIIGEVICIIGCGAKAFDVLNKLKK